MPVATGQHFTDILNKAQAGKYALAAINVTGLETANAALEAFAREKADGIIQVSIGAGKHASGPLKNSVEGAISIAEHVHRIAAKLDVFIGLHTDHCQFENLDFIRGLLDASKRRVAKGQQPLFSGHMFDGSALPLAKNIDVAKEILVACSELQIVPEFEAGVVGGEEEGAATTSDHSKLYTTPEDMLAVADALYPIGAPFLFAATFGNVHGIYKPGNVKLNPAILRDGQAAVKAKHGKPFYLVFHGGSGTPVEQIRETLDYGVVKMNVDTAAQYAFTRPIADHMFKNYDGVLMVDGEVGDKKVYDPRAYLKLGMSSMSQRVSQAIFELRGEGKTACSR